MRVVIAGGHGKIALLLERLLAERGDQAVGLIRNPAQAGDLQQAGAEAAVCDLETASADEVAGLLAGADAVVFAAGAGPGSGARRKDTVHRAASVLLAEAAARAGVRSSCRSPPWKPRRRNPAGTRSGQLTSRPRPPPRTISRSGTWTGPSCARAALPTPPPPEESGSPPAGPPGHDPPRRRGRGHHRPARRAGHPAPDAGAGQWRHSDRRSGGQHLVSCTPDAPLVPPRSPLPGHQCRQRRPAS